MQLCVLRCVACFCAFVAVYTMRRTLFAVASIKIIYYYNFFFFCFGIVIAKLCVSLDVNTYLVDGNGNSLWLSGCTLSYGG